MRGRIYKSLLFMGIISVVVTFILSAILYYQGMQEQISAELGRTAHVLSGAVSKDKEENFLWQDMERDLAQQILRRLAVAQPLPVKTETD